MLITLNYGGEPLPVDPLKVAYVAKDTSRLDAARCLVGFGGKEFKIRGTQKEVLAILGLSSDIDSFDPEWKPGEPRKVKVPVAQPVKLQK